MNRSIVVLSSALLTFSTGLPAEPEVLDLAALLAEAERAHPGIRAQVERAAAAAEVAPRVEAPPDPELSVSYTNDGLDELTLGTSQFSNVTVRWDQDLPRKSVRKGSAEVARREESVVLAQATNLRAEVRRRTIEAYAGIWRADREHDLLAEGRTVLVASLEAARARYEAGQGAQEGLLRAQTELRRADLELETASRQRRGAEIALLEALGRDGDAKLGPALTLPPVEAPAAEELERAVGAGPELRVATAEVERAGAATERARAATKTEWGFMAAYQYLGSLDPMVMGGVTVKLPLWRSSKQAREVAEAEHTAQAVALEKEAAQNTAVARARDLLAEIDSIRRQRALLDEALIPEGIATLEAARAGYGAGRAEMGVVLDDLTRLLGDRRRLAALSAREVIAAAELERITGLAILGGAR